MTKKIVCEKGERWKEIPGLEGYSVSSLGRVWSKRFPRSLKQSTDRDGYRVLFLGGANFRVHRLVLIAFRGEPEKGQDASHIDGSRDNNVLSNLIWESSKRNQNRKREHGTQAQGCAVWTSKLSPKIVRMIRKSKKSGSVLARELGVDKSTVNRARSGRTWRWL